MIELPEALSVPALITLVSDSKLCAQVAAEVGGEAARVVPVQEFSAGRTTVTPMRLLHSLGRATSSLPALQQSGAASMPGRTAFNLTSIWAIARYVWAFDNADPRLKFSPVTDQLRHHGKTLFSEQVGISAATHLIEDLVFPRHLGAASSIDVDSIYANDYLGPIVANLGAHRPDYLVHAPGTDSVVVLEVKGNSSGRRQAVRQLARAVAQVSVVPEFVGFTMRRIAIATTVINRRVCCYGIEVPLTRDQRRKQATLMASARVPLEETRPNLWGGSDLSAVGHDAFQAFPDDLEEGAVIDALNLGEWARLRTYAGDQTDLRQASRMRRTHSQPSAATTPVTREVAGTEYEGTALIYQLDDTLLELYAGVDAGIAAQLRTGPPISPSRDPQAPPSDAPPRTVQRPSSRYTSDAPFRTRRVAGTSVAVTDADGTVLELTTIPAAQAVNDWPVRG